uniref:Uncharacterized protein n=1 Tax=Setaria italica TaxID=4555 RepID=K4AI06_SETIT
MTGNPATMCQFLCNRNTPWTFDHHTMPGNCLTSKQEKKLRHTHFVYRITN